MPGVGGEPDLVVDDDVDGPVRGVGGQVRQMHGLEHYALPCKRRVTVQQEGHHLRIGLGVKNIKLLSLYIDIFIFMAIEQKYSIFWIFEMLTIGTKS